MKSLITLLVIVVASVPALAQDPVPEPQFNDVFVGLSAGKLVPLERETSAIKSGGGGFIVASAKAAYEFPGDKSPIRFSAAKPLEFVVRSAFASSSVDPSTFYVLRRLNSKKKSRELVFMNGHVSPIGGSFKTNLSEGVIPVTFAKYGSSSYKVTSPGLPPGEYALSMANGQTVYCFGVD